MAVFLLFFGSRPFLLEHVCCLFRLMVRKGWTKIEVPEGWTQIIRSPPLAKWQPQKGKRIPSAASKNGNDVKSPSEKPAVPCKESVPPDVAAAAARKSGEARGCFGFAGRGRRHFPCHSGSPHDSASASSSSASVRTHPRLQVVFGERTQTGRGCPSNNCQGMGELGRGPCGAGEAGFFSRRRTIFLLSLFHLLRWTLLRS